MFATLDVKRGLRVHDKTIRIWDLETGTLTGEALLGHTGPVHAIAFSPDSQFIVSGGGDKTTRLWSMQTRTQLGETLTEHTSLVVTISFSPDGRTFATGSFDETMIICDVETRTPIGDPMRGHRRDVNCLAYSPDGELIVTGSFDETVRLWTRNASGSRKCPTELPFSIDISSSSSTSDLPPTYDADCHGSAHIFVNCRYSLKITIVDSRLFVPTRRYTSLLSSACMKV